jgi:hypothetical protein
LFHYQRFCESHLISLLATGKLKLSRPDSFNDPWDCRVHYRVPTDPEERERLIAHLAELHRKHHPSISEVERKRRADFLSNPSELEAAVAENEKHLYAAICNQYRVYCLTEKPDSTIMGAHYACSHYRATYPDYDFVGGGYPALFTKSDVWSYEAEWRLIVEERGFARSAWTVKTDNDFLTLHSGVLKSVTIGCLADESSRQRIEHFVITNAPGVLVRQATLMPDRYELRINPPFG